MEKDAKEIIEKTEQKENSTEKKGRSDKRNSNRKRSLLITLGIILVLCFGTFIFIRINTTETHVYEEVENLGEREGVCFDNLMFSSSISIFNSRNGEIDYRYLCIFNTGDVYCFKWSSELKPFNWYYWGSEEGHERGYDDTHWTKTENAVYLGRLSNWDIFRLNQYIQNYDAESEYYNVLMEDPYYYIDLHSNEQSWQVEKAEKEIDIWKSYYVTIYWCEKNGYDGIDVVIDACSMDYLGNNTYEQGELWLKSYDENAIAALELFESSEFYDRWIAMCLNNE